MKQTPKKAEDILREGIDIIEENARLKRELKEQQKEINKWKNTILSILQDKKHYKFGVKEIKELKAKLKEVKK